MKCWITCGIFLLWSAGAWARHIIGGDIALVKQSATSNNYILTLTLIYDDVLGSTDDKANISSFQKSNNLRIQDFILSRSSRQELPYSNARCVPGAQASLITLVRYTSIITLSPTTYNDAQGYYFSWEECCRNEGIINIQNPNRSGLAFYAEVSLNNVQTALPQFKIPEVKYVCAGKNFEADFGATSSEGSDLRYSLVTPLIGSTDPGGVFPEKPKQGPYNQALWATGFDSTKAVSGTRPLQIDAKTGKINLNASQLGMYAFAVRCEEWKQGVKTGEVRREFVLNVIDCIAAAPPPAFIEILTASPTISYQSEPSGHVPLVDMCNGDSVVLKADDENPQWAYQWLKDDQPIANANRSFLPVYQAGNYTLVKRFAESCGTEESTSNFSRVNVKNASLIHISSSRSLPLCSNDSTTLSIEPVVDATVRWFQNGTDIGNSSPSLLNVKLAGTYSVSVTDINTKCAGKDSVLIKVIQAPSAPLTLTGTPIFCANDSVKLITPFNKAYEYAWYREDMPLFQAFGNEFFPDQSARYSVAVIDTATKCVARSVTVNIVVKPSPTVTLEPIPPLCTASLQTVTLSGTPAGGTFSGQGVSGNQFVSQDLPTGTYPVTYTYTNAQGCSAKDTKPAYIAPVPRLEVPKKLVILRGDSIQIKTITPPNASFIWFPSIGLDNPQSATPTAGPDRNTTYRITATTGQGCVVEGEVYITVIDLNIPNGFTPNNDGANDTWEIAGIRDFPNCTIEVFNRWGNPVFSNKGYETPWDGKWNGEFVPVGTYYYHIYLREFEYKLTGSLNVIR